MKFSLRILAAALMTGATACGSASASDMYSMRPGGYTDSQTNWAGTYFGAHLGGASATDAVSDINGAWCPTAHVGCSYSNNAQGLLLGVQFGYNIQYAHYVLGPELDFGYMDLTNTKPAPGYTLSDASSALSGGFYTAVTGRMGYDFAGALVYAKGGYANFGGKLSNYSSDAGYSVGTSGISGWTLGGGAEYKINSSWSVKVEYLYFDFGKVTNTFPASSSCGGVPCTFENNLTANSVKLGINVNISTAGAPME